MQLLSEQSTTGRRKKIHTALRADVQMLISCFYLRHFKRILYVDSDTITVNKDAPVKNSLDCSSLSLYAAMW